MILTRNDRMDLSRRNPGGRPKTLPPEAVKSERIPVAVTLKQKRLVQKRAQEEGMELPAFVRAWIDKGCPL